MSAVTQALRKNKPDSMPAASDSARRRANMKHKISAATRAGIPLGEEMRLASRQGGEAEAAAKSKKSNLHWSVKLALVTSSMTFLAILTIGGGYLWAQLSAPPRPAPSFVTDPGQPSQASPGSSMAAAAVGVGGGASLDAASNESIEDVEPTPNAVADVAGASIEYDSKETNPALLEEDVEALAAASSLETSEAANAEEDAIPAKPAMTAAIRVTLIADEEGEKVAVNETEQDKATEPAVAVTTPKVTERSSDDDVPSVSVEEAKAAPVIIRKPQEQVPKQKAETNPQAPRKSEGFTLRLATLKVEGIFWDKERPMAIVNGEIIEIGSNLSGAEVVAIDSNSITLEMNGIRRKIRP